jgi:hypothetical protein
VQAGEACRNEHKKVPEGEREHEFDLMRPFLRWELTTSGTAVHHVAIIKVLRQRQFPQIKHLVTLARVMRCERDVWLWQ